MKGKQVSEGRRSRRPYPMRISLGFLLHDVARIRRKLLDGVLRPLELTRAQRWLLIQLSQFGDAGISQAELADKMDMGPVSLGEKVLLLEKLGHVVRDRSPIDRRQKILRLTPAGDEALQRSTELTKAFNSDVLAGISPEDLEAAERVLAAMRANLLKMDEV